MACNSCARSFSLLRKEKGCPGCGFSYCPKCLDNKVFLPKTNSEAKVCAKCKRSLESGGQKKIEPPDAYYRRLGAMKIESSNDGSMLSGTVREQNTKDQEILDRLRKLKEDSKTATKGTSEDEIARRLQKIKGEIPSTSDAELQSRLAKLKGVPIGAVQSKPVLPAPDLRSEQEQADDLMKQYMEQTKIDSMYKEEFDGLLNDIESRLHNLKGSTGSSSTQNPELNKEPEESDDEEEIVRKMVEKVKTESLLEDDSIPPPTNDELPFCEICNEDAQMRCTGCRYLFCKRCFLEHRDDDDGCNRYEPYTPPKGTQY